MCSDAPSYYRLLVGRRYLGSPVGAGDRFPLTVSESPDTMPEEDGDGSAHDERFRCQTGRLREFAYRFLRR